MPIYSANRTGSFNVAQIPANESYKWNDIGRILCESQANDMAFFEAALACDFTEVKGLREGTILESEIASFTEAAEESLIEKLIKRVQEFIAKIKGVFRSLVDKMEAFTRNDKKLVKDFKKKLDADQQKNTWTGEYTLVDLTHKAFNLSNAAIKFSDTKNGIPGKTEYINSVLRTNLGVDGDVSPKTYAQMAIKAASKTQMRTLTQILDEIEKDNELDRIRKLQAAVEKNSQDRINELKAKKREAASEEAKDSVQVLIDFESAWEITSSTIIKAAIAGAKFNARNRHNAVAAAIRETVKTAKHEAAVLDELEDVEDIFEDELNDGLPEEVKD